MYYAGYAGPQQKWTTLKLDTVSQGDADAFKLWGPFPTLEQGDHMRDTLNELEAVYAANPKNM